MFEQVDDKLNGIYREVQATNGKVASIQKWRERVTGAAWAMGGVFSIVILPLLVWALIRINSIPEIVAQTLENYQIEIID